MSEITASLTIQDDGKSAFEITGDYRLMLALMGGLDCLKDRARVLYQEKYGMHQVERTENIDAESGEVHNESVQQNPVGEIKVSKKRALDLYLETRNLLDKRMKAIADSSDNTTFQIDLNIIKKL